MTVLLAGQAAATPVTFRFPAPASVQSVSVAGSFNDWNISTAPLADHNGVWEATLDLAPGSYQYKLVVNGSQWLTDESAKGFADDGFGGKNSVVEVGAEAMTVGAAAAAPAGGGAAVKAPAGGGAAIPAPPSGMTRVTFRYQPAPGARTVSVAGSFNNWTVDATPLQDPTGGGIWEAVLDLAPGTYQYKFVIDGSQWKTDETATESTDDGFGGKNSVLNVAGSTMTVGLKAGASPKPVKDGGPTPAAGATTSVTFRYQPVIGGVNSASVAGSFNGWDATKNPMSDPDKDGVWEATVLLPAGKTEYKFVVNGDQWFVDDFAPDSAPDGLGGQNSVVIVGANSMILGPGGNVAAKGNAPPAGLRQVTFRFKPTGKPASVMLAGTFNDWNVGKAPLGGPDAAGEYTATLLLQEGEYQYKFVADGNWTTDTVHADSYVDDGFGGKNSVVRVDSRFPAVEVKLGDGKVSGAGIDHSQTSTEVNNMGGGRVEITFRSHRGDIQGMDLLVREGTAERTLAMAPAGQDGAFEYWRGTVTGGAAGSFEYLAAYKDAAAVEYLTASGMTADRPAPDAWFHFTSAAFPPFETPDWVKDAVIYQIFPDRFKNGNPANDPDFSAWYYQGKTSLPSSGKTNDEYYHLVADWSDISGLIRSPYRTDAKPDYFSFYGGDIEGVRQELGYLQDLGVTAIYFNPIFQAKSNHKYDCADFLKLDPAFGTNDDFKTFVQEAHAKGIRIVLDIVFNHCGNGHWAFADAVKNGPQSPTYNWFEFKKWPLPAQFGAGGAKPEDYYQCWWGFGDLPDLNFDLSRANPQENGIKSIAEAQPNQALLDHLSKVTAFWIGEMDCDGVRLDVPTEVPFWYWKQFNREVKTLKKDAYIVGELWGNAADYVGPTLFDATMNYAYFRDPVTKFIGQGRGTAEEFDRTMATGRNAYPTQAVQVMMNLVGSHDTVRYREQIGGDPKRVKLTALFAMTYVGAPHVYYGDEIGMMGGKDPDCRRPFLWNWKENADRVDLHDTYRALGKARAAHAALRRGDFTALLAKGSVYAYARSAGNDRVVVALNTGAAPATVTLDAKTLGGATEGVDLITGKSVSLSGPIALDPVSGIAVVLK